MIMIITLTMIPAYLEIIPPMNDSAESPHQVGYESKIHIRCHASEVVSPYIELIPG